jgi:endonuclease/exonuclease/phosphatase family metal-dependent hydrolase
VVLQEVTPDIYEEFKKAFDLKYHVIYSLNYRKPSKFDGKERTLGILMLISKHYNVHSAKVLKRSLFPERTLLVEIINHGEHLKIMGIHSITGSAYYKAKSVQFASLAEALQKHRPEFLMIDANEPEVDHPDEDKITYWDNDGDGVFKFFTTLKKIGLKDAYRVNHLSGHSPFITSYIDKKTKIKRRYDYIFIKAKRHKLKKIEYLYDKAIEAGSDHALVLCELK